MPKQKRYKNLLKAAAANSSQDKSIVVANSSGDKSAASNASQVKSAAAANSSRETSAATNFSRDKLAAAANSSRDKSAASNSSQDKSAASNSSRDKSAAASSSRDKSAAASSSRDKSAAAASSSRDKSVASNSSEHPSEPKRKHGRESKHHWTVDAIDEYENSTRLHLLAKDVHNLPEGLRIVVNFDKYHAAIGEAAGLLAGVCGQLATDCVAFPISFEKWSDIPASFFENQWNIFFLARFYFKVSDNLAKRFMLQSLGKKWREHRIKLWNDFYDPRLSKTEIINNAPEDIAPDQWALFVEYRLKPETQKLCKRNQEIRQKQIIPHTSGAKSIARRRAELTEETGKEVSRVQMWDITHKKIDESYVNEKAKEIAEKIEAHSSQQPMESTVNSPLDALRVVFGKEHPGRVRGLGMGAVPTIAFKNNTTRISQMNLGSSNDVGTSSTCGPNVQEELDAVKAQLQVSYIASKEGGKIPIQLAGMFPTQQVSQGLDQESEIPSPKELGSRSSGASNKEA
ncbi:uncharacterized protein [Arachis hypogaea]|nr:uncharacterized protein LOC112772730 isoform X3 [Arachis hypogaea]XP_025673514.1 uncharacterized protein LOC112772730 isoform X3 [Arachis hypogaea]XP_025673515.1 uncharacterized protein LOC112772730 isoform X3 [Arachis hypogaea]